MLSLVLKTGRVLTRDDGGDGKIHWERSAIHNHEAEAVTIFPDGGLGWGSEQDAGRELWDALAGIVPSQRRAATLDQMAALLGG